MSGHNKWSQIVRQKSAEDAKKSKLFSLLARSISAEVKKSGGDINSATVKTAIEKARKANMPKDNIERALQRGKGGDATDMTPFVAETYGPGGVAVIIHGITDNTNRTLSEIKHLLATHGAALAAQGSASWAFTKNPEGGLVATTTTPLEDADLELLTKLVDELENHEDVEAVFTNAE